MEALLSRVIAERADVEWKSESAVAGDFDGDGRSDIAVFGIEASGILVAIEATSATPLRRAQYLAFGVGGGVQQAVCSLPVRLETLPLVGADEDGRLPGCRDQPPPSLLNLIDDECDSIYVYWDHDRSHMTWWRR